jgi:protein TonB
VHGALANLSGQGAGAGSTTLAWALAASLALHAALLAGLPDLWTFSPAPATAPLNARLEPGTPPGDTPSAGAASRAVDAPSPPLAMPAPEPAPVPSLQHATPRQRPAETKPAPPLARLPAVPSPPAAVPRADAPAETPPAAQLAAAAGAAGSGGASGEPTLAPRAGDEALDYGSLAQYRLALIGTAKRHRLYPPYAVERGWHGRVGVRLAIGADGDLAAAQVYASSGHPVLDDQALDMLRKAAALTPLPPALRAREFTVEVPVVFELRAER